MHSRPIQQRVIINADDLGMSEKVNDAIFTMLEKGRVNSATMLANGPAFATAAIRARRYPNCSFGVHLNLTEFSPLSQSSEVRTLLTADGRLSSQSRSRGMSAAFLSGAFREFCAQIDRVQAELGKISHVDSHHHVHTMPALFPVLAAVVRKYRIRKIRPARNIFMKDDKKSGLLLAKKWVWNMSSKHALGLRTADYFTDLLSFIDNRPCEECSVEIMVHPGHDAYAEEQNMLDREWWTGAGLTTSFINYDQL
jgi:hypothetical protein